MNVIAIPYNRQVLSDIRGIIIYTLEGGVEMENMGSRILRLMKAADPPWSCRTLGERLHVSPGTISDWTSGKTKTIPDHHVKRMARLFKRPESWLRYGEAGYRLDEPVLTEIIELVLISIDENRLVMSNRKKAQFISMFYQMFIEDRRVDPSLIRQLVSLASKEA